MLLSCCCIGSYHDSVIGLFPAPNPDNNADKYYKCNVAGQYAPRILLVNIISNQGHHEFPKAISDENRPSRYWEDGYDGAHLIGY